MLAGARGGDTRGTHKAVSSLRPAKNARHPGSVRRLGFALLDLKSGGRANMMAGPVRQTALPDKMLDSLLQLLQPVLRHVHLFGQQSRLDRLVAWLEHELEERRRQFAVDTAHVLLAGRQLRSNFSSSDLPSNSRPLKSLRPKL